MKKIIATATALILLVVVTNAQTDSTQMRPHHKQWGNMEKGEGKHEDRFVGREGHHGKRMHKPHIKLTEEQRNQAKTINESYEKQLTSLYDNDKLRMGDFKKKYAVLRKERKDNLAAILTPDQKEKIASFKKKHEEDRLVKAAARLERMKINLDLKDEQVNSIKAAQTSFHEQMKTLHQDESLLPEQKKGKMKALMAQHKETVKAILTPEQLNKLESVKKQKEWKG